MEKSFKSCYLCIRKRGQGLCLTCFAGVLGQWLTRFSRDCERAREWPKSCSGSDFWKSFKKVSKRFGSYENPPYLCTRNLNETTRREWQSSEDCDKKTIVLYRIYRTRFFEIIEQLNSFITLLLKSFQSNTFENKPRFNKQYFFIMESLILAQDER